MTETPLSSFYRLHHYPEIGSTNDELGRLAQDGAPEGTLVLADRQTAGRGRQGRDWSSPAGNLFASILVKPAVATARLAELSFLTAVTLGDAVGTRARFKWPNDLLIDGRKFAGILLESASIASQPPPWLIIGVGVNIRAHPGDAAFPATNLKEAGLDMTREALLSTFCAAFEIRYRAWQAAGFEPLRDAWLARAEGLGGPIVARLSGGRHEQGTFAGLDATGALLLKRADGRVDTIAAGDIFFSDGT